MKIYQTIIIALVALLVTGCGTVTTQQTPSPTEVLKSFIEATKKKDVEAIKKTLSKGSLELAEKSAKERNTTVDEMLKQDNSMMPDEIPEMRNERIEGDTASVEVKNLTSGYDTIPFVKEDGAWKIAFDKYQETLMNKMREEMKMPASNVSKPDGERQPGSKSETNK